MQPLFRSCFWSRVLALIVLALLLALIVLATGRFMPPSRSTGVVLMHDFDKSPPRGNSLPHADHVISLTTRIIEFAGQDGYPPMRSGDVLKGAQG